MGIATEHASIGLRLYEAPTSMKSTLLVKDREENKYLFHSAEHYRTGCSEHVERLLMEKFKAAYPDPASIPNNAVIIFCANWSPCKRCLTKDIPEFLKWCNFAKRTFTIKFRFNCFYSKEHKSPNPNNPHSGTFIWGSENEAQTEYDRYSTQYFSSSRTKDVMLTVDDSQQIMGVKISPRLVFAHLAVSKTSFLNY